ncbi:arylsulfatase [uncultured Imperialibacter sp.]|uniref:sulfatase family protein n=1 Tax=uncultured Imperialibacter sp. TaxID=1672639 RepID=UPI0030DA4A0E|tara:strand:- start:28424 stop:29944 length:1521 start_codon:yes stop_codon:yes gene_type:complete
MINSSSIKALSLVTLAAALGCKMEPAEETTPKPNIIVILADDLGYGDVSAYGSNTISTPNIDQLAAAGLRFTQGYCTSATCTPSRYGLLTGVYPWRNKDARVLPGDAPALIRPGMATLPSLLKKAGYKTAVVGKWHLGLGDGNVNWNERISPGPNDIGFDYSYMMAATNDRVPTVFVENQRVVGLEAHDPLMINYKENFPGEPTGKDNPELLKMHPSHGHDMSIHNGISRIGFMKGGKAALWRDEDMADVFVDKAREFMTEQKDGPFFLYFALHQPHVPRTPNERFVGQSGMGPRGDAIVEADWCVGEITKHLESLGLSKNTLIVFSSDNGPVIDDGYQDQAVELLGDHQPLGPLRGGKYSLFDGGTRVPFIVSWPGKVKAGVSDALVCQVDLPASLSSLVGVTADSGTIADSKNVIDALLGKSDIGRSSLVLHASGTQAIRNLKWYLIPPNDGPAIYQYTNTESGRDTAMQLYQISDPGQKINIAAENPEAVAELEALLLAEKKK